MREIVGLVKSQKKIINKHAPMAIIFRLFLQKPNMSQVSFNTPVIILNNQFQGERAQFIEDVPDTKEN